MDKSRYHIEIFKKIKIAPIKLLHMASNGCMHFHMCQSYKIVVI